MSPRKPLTHEAIIDAAMLVIDQEGLDKLSMRRLGTELGVEAMSLYNHVPNKDAVLDAIHERLLLSVPTPRAGGNWQTFVRHQALGLHRVLLAHPRAIPLFATRPAATPAAIDRLSAYLEVLAEAGFKPFDALSLIQLIAQLVVGHAMWTAAVDVVSAPEDPPPQVARALEKWNPDRELAIGIDAMLRGFEALLR